MTEAARQALRRLDVLLADNSDPLKSAIANLNTFSGALARNSDRVDGILAGLERMTGGGAKAAPVVYDLTAPRTFARTDKVAKAQLVVPEPTTVLTLDTQRILIHTADGEGPSVETAEWSDNIPKLLQAKVIQSFENSNTMQGVARPMDGLNADDQLLIDIRSFQVTGPETPAAHVEFSAKILSDKGRIVGSRTFEASAPCADTSVPAATTALNQAFGKAVSDLVVWTAGLI
jgi:phospholipid/cholesterol/gamma-HCH transport system substrate-binding protein